MNTTPTHPPATMSAHSVQADGKAKGYIMIESTEPVVTRCKLLSLQVCVPSDWTDGQVTEFANRENLAGTVNGWQIRHEGDPLLAGQSERVQCANRAGFVHVMLDC